MNKDQFIIDKISNERGLGLFTRYGYNEGDRVGIYGKPRDEFNKCEEAEIYWLPFHRSSLKFVESVLGRYINHSITPNVNISIEDKAWVFYANQKILPYDELTVDYNFVSNYFNDIVTIPTDEGIRYNLKQIYNF